MTAPKNHSSRADHDGGIWLPANVRVVASWPVGSFAENLAVSSDGAVFVSLYSGSRLDRYEVRTGRTRPFASLTAPAMGVAITPDDTLWVTGGAFPDGPGHVWRVGKDGTTEHWADLPDARFINGCTLHPDGVTLLACESLSGRILAIDLRAPSQWTVWLSDDILRPSVPHVPGANGIKIKDGCAWVTVSARQVLVRIHINRDGTAGLIETVAERLRGDDFAIGASGALYIATHTAQTVMRLDMAGGRATLAGPEQGAAGATACAFGRAPGDANALYVTTTGGLLAPHGGAVQEAKLLRMRIDDTAWSSGISDQRSPPR